VFILRLGGGAAAGRKWKKRHVLGEKNQTLSVFSIQREDERRVVVFFTAVYAFRLNGRRQIYIDGDTKGDAAEI